MLLSGATDPDEEQALLASSSKVTLVEGEKLDSNLLL
jgi:hypothetical protein